MTKILVKCFSLILVLTLFLSCTASSKVLVNKEIASFEPVKFKLPDQYELLFETPDKSYGLVATVDLSLSPATLNIPSYRIQKYNNKRPFENFIEFVDEQRDFLYPDVHFYETFEEYNQINNRDVTLHYYDVSSTAVTGISAYINFKNFYIVLDYFAYRTELNFNEFMFVLNSIDLNIKNQI